MAPPRHRTSDPNSRGNWRTEALGPESENPRLSEGHSSCPILFAVEPESRLGFYNDYRGCVQSHATRNTAPSNCSLHRTITSLHCEYEACVESAVWIILYPKTAQFLCREHTLECMSDSNFWRLRSAHDKEYGKRMASNS